MSTQASVQPLRHVRRTGGPNRALLRLMPDAGLQDQPAVGGTSAGAPWIDENYTGSPWFFALAFGLCVVGTAMVVLLDIMGLLP